MGYYDPLRDYLTRRGDAEVTLSFAEIEGIIGRPLPPSARKYDAWWANVGDSPATRHSHARSWDAAGYRARVNRREGKALFYRPAGNGAVPKARTGTKAPDALIPPVRARGGGKTVALIACSKQKRSVPCWASELYAPSTLFALSYAYAKRIADRVYILSAKYGLVAEDAVIAPYDETLNDKSVEERKAWSRMVLSQLSQVCDLRRDHFILLAGSHYCEYLLPWLESATLPLGNLPLGKRVKLLRRYANRDPELPEDGEGDALWLHRLFGKLPRYDWQGIDDIPFDDGIYIVYERGETYHGDARVVRVGTHTAPGRLKGRLRDHFIRENHNGSIFRKNIGKALLNRAHDPYVEVWSLDTSRPPYRGRENPQTEARIELEVSSYMRVNLSLSVIPVASAEERLRLEAAIIATLNQAGDFVPSDGWLGRHSPEREIRESGLWLKQGLDAKPLTAAESLRLARIILPGG